MPSPTATRARRRAGVAAGAAQHQPAPGRFGGPEVASLFLNRLDYGSHPWLARLRGAAHFFIRRDGAVIQFVSTEDRAWHAGVSRYAGRERCNDFSIGIELEGTDTLPYADAQYQALRQLALRARYPLAAWDEHIAPGRKTDPGQLSTGRASGAKTASRGGNCRPPDAPSHHSRNGYAEDLGTSDVRQRAESHAGRARTGAAARVHLAGGEHGVVDTPDYAERNPNRQVPVIDDGGFVLWESNAIVRYLSARYGVGSLWTEDLGLRADADRWMDWQATEWQPAMVPAFKGLVRTPEDKRDRAVIDASMQRANARALILERALQGREFIAGRQLSMGDIALVASAHRWLGLPAERPQTPTLSAWYRRIMMRPAAQGVLTLPLE